MADVAEVVFKADTKELKKAVGDINNFNTSAKSAQKSADQLGVVIQKTSVNTAKETAEIKKNTIERNKNNAATKQQSRLRSIVLGENRKLERLATGVDPRTGKLARDLGVNRFNTANIAAQFQDIGVTAAMGMNPMTIALQQGTQLSAILNNMGDPVKGLAEAFKQLINPVALASIGITGLIAGLVQIVDWSKVGSSSLKFLGDNIRILTAGVLATGVAFAYLNREVITNWASGMVKGIGAVVKAMKTLILTTNLFSVTLKGIRTIAAATWAVITAPVTLIAAAIGAVVYAVLELTGAFDYLKQKFTEWKDNRDNAKVWDEMTKSINKELEALKLESSLIGESDVVKESARKRQELLNKAIDKGVKLTDEQIKKITEQASEIGRLTVQNREREEYLKNKSEFLERLEKENAELIFQRKLLGLSERDVEKLSYAQKLRNEAIESGLINDKDMMTTFEEASIENRIQNLVNEKNALIDTKYELAEYSKMENYAKSTTTSFFTDMNHALIEGQSLWEAFGDAVTNVLTKILDKMTEVGVDYLFAAGKASGWFGLASGGRQVYESAIGPTQTPNASGFYGLGNALGSAWDRGIQKYATGGVVGSPTLFGTRAGLGLMGEAGPEAIMPLKRGSDGSLGVRADGIGGANVVVNVINNSNAKASVNQRQTSQGTEIDVMIDQLVADKLGTQGTASNTAMNNWNNRQLIAR